MALSSYNMIEEPEDHLRFEYIYQNYHKQMLLVASRVLKNMEDTEDAVQDALLRIARNIDTIRNQEEWAVRGYVLTVTKNSALKILEKNLRRNAGGYPLNPRIAQDEEVFNRVVNSLDYALLVRAVKHLDLRYRQVLMLVYLQKQTPKEAADILGRKEDTVRKQLHRGRKLLIEFCNKEGLNYGNE